MSSMNDTGSINGTNNINGADNTENTVKTGLVLEGGGMRGMYTDGILDVFLDQELSFDGVIGVSAGAIHGSSFVSGQRGRSIRYYKKYIRDNRFISMRNLVRTGDIAEVQFCYHDLPEKLDLYDYDAFNRSKTEFYAVCSNVETGKAEYLPITDMKEQIDRMRASASLPLVSKIVKTAGLKLLDGGCTDSIPVKAFAKMGYTKDVVVLTRHKGYRKEIEGTGLTKLVYRKYPEFVKAVYRRPSVYNHTLDEIEKWEEEGKIFVIRPSVPLTIGRMEADPKKIKEVYELGRDDARRQIEDMKVFLGIE